MTLTIVEEPLTRLAEYAQVPMGFTVAERFDEQALAALRYDASVQAVAVSPPYWKDYDSYSGGHPSGWTGQFELSRWTILAAYDRTRRVGGAVLIVDDPQIDLLRDCPACALLWDLRVAPNARRQGVGSALLEAAEQRARARCSQASCRNAGCQCAGMSTLPRLRVSPGASDTGSLRGAAERGSAALAQAAAVNALRVIR